jgi:transcription initiation factor TFIIIB Brf1 subunit/transcription initiation factor TFIIB
VPTPEDWLDMRDAEPFGAIVKYNPCTKHARGSVCPHFARSRKCGKAPLTCDMPEYDMWYKEVLRGKTKSYYPIRIRLLEKPGTFMFLFHVDYHAIVGEVQIIKTTKEDNRNHYWFNNFISYPHPVQLELLETDPRLRWIARKSRTRCVYIDHQSIDEIRTLAKLSEKERLRKGKDFDRALRQMKRSYGKKERRSTPNFDMDKEYQKLNRNYEIGEQVLTEAKKHYFSFVRKKPRLRRSLYEMFYASVYLAFRTLAIPKLLHEISDISGVSSKRLAKLYRLMVKELDIVVQPVDVEELAKCQSTKLGISEETIDRVVAIIREERIKGNLVGKAPSVVAAVATFIACQERDEKKELKKIAESFGVSAESIKNAQ